MGHGLLQSRSSFAPARVIHSISSQPRRPASSQRNREAATEGGVMRLECAGGSFAKRRGCCGVPPMDRNGWLKALAEARSRNCVSFYVSGGQILPGGRRGVGFSGWWASRVFFLWRSKVPDPPLRAFYMQDATPSHHGSAQVEPSKEPPLPLKKR
jgi:hypothetical protein